jgi:cellulose biosynthesis protein BcsQ
MKNVLAICDREKEYAHRLMEYISRKNSILLKAVAFSNEESLREFAEENEIEVLLIEESMLSEKIMDLKTEKIILLREEQNKKTDFTESVYKYTSADRLVKEVISLYDAENSIKNVKTDWRNRKKIIGIYTPVGGTRKTSFALTLGQIMAKESAVLYMNLEGFSGLGEILEGGCERGLSELLYYAGQKSFSPASKLGEVTVTRQNLDIVPPAESPDDIHSIKGREWVRLFENIMSLSDYKTLILDLGDEVDGLEEILSLCSRIYVPVREDRLSEAKFSEFMRYIKMNMIDDKKIRQLHVPFYKAARLGNEYMENLSWSELGDYVRKIAQEEF